MTSTMSHHHPEPGRGRNRHVYGSCVASILSILQLAFAHLVRYLTVE
jgi:hypothetical protein